MDVESSLFQGLRGAIMGFRTVWLAVSVLSAAVASWLPTPPLADERPRLAADALVTRVAFGSCADQNAAQPIWATIRAAVPDLFIFAGDNVYADDLHADLRRLRAAYEKLGRIAGFEDLVRKVPVTAVWDDHDYGVNDSGADYPHRLGSQEVFLDFWRVAADDPRRARDGIYTQTVHGPPGRQVQIILLDTRFFRSKLTWRPGVGYVPDRDPSKTMLGEAQWQWLAGALRQPAALRLIVSSIQVLPTEHRFEKWHNLPRERARLFDLIGATGANGVILLSGDRHFGAIYRLDQGVAYPLYELTSSALNMARRSKDTGRRHQISPAVAVDNFGLVTIDWEARTVALDLRGVDGRSRASRVIELTEIRGDGG